jgi:peroxiredoxin
MSSRVTLPRGTPAPEVTMTTVDGVTRSLPDLRGRRLTLAFFAAGCQPCLEVLPDFVALARSAPGGAEQVFAIVGGEGSAVDTFVDALRRVAQVVAEPVLGEIARAFSVTVFPSFYQVDEDGSIAAGGPTLRSLEPELV